MYAFGGRPKKVVVFQKLLYRFLSIENDFRNNFLLDFAQHYQSRSETILETVIEDRLS